MKNAFYLPALLCAILSFATSHAQAFNQDQDTVRSMQMRLASFGYYVGPYDGIMGAETEGALRDFQRDNGLYANGHVTGDTIALLDDHSRGIYHPVHYVNYYNNDPYFYYRDFEPVVMHPMVTWEDRWHYSRVQNLPARFGDLKLTEDDRGGLRYYAVLLNGHPIFFADNQPGILRVSQTFGLHNEDAVIFTAYHGDGICTYKHYLLTLHSDGTYTQPREIGSCGGNLDARVTDNALLISFPSDSTFHGWAAWDTWRYQNNTLVRL
jgi:hypothetical protein